MNNEFKVGDSVVILEDVEVPGELLLRKGAVCRVINVEDDFVHVKELESFSKYGAWFTRKSNVKKVYKTKIFIWNGFYGFYERDVIYTYNSSTTELTFYEKGECDPAKLVERLANWQSQGIELIFSEPDTNKYSMTFNKPDTN